MLITPEISTLMTLVLYAFAGVAGLVGMMVKNRTLRALAASVAACGFILQTVILFMGFHTQAAGGLSVGAYLQMLAWFLMLCGLVLWVVVHQEIPLLFGSLLALILFGISARQLEMVVAVPKGLAAPFYALHVGALYISLALIAISFVSGLLFLYLDTRLKNKRHLPRVLSDIPALNILDSINNWGTLAGFPLFTIGIVCGLFYAKPVYGSTMNGDPKEIISIFGLSLFSIVVVNLFMNSHHAFVRI